MNLLNSNLSTYLYVKDNGELVGFFSYLRKKNNKVFLCDVFIKKQYRSRGLGKKLIKYAIENVDEFQQNCEAIYVYVYSNNIVFYMKNGFTIYKKENNDTYTLIYKLKTNYNKLIYLLGLILIVSLLLLLWWYFK